MGLSQRQRGLVEAHLAMVDKLARYYARRYGLDREEVGSVLSLALVEAAARFRPGKDASFASFAWRRLQGAVIDELRRQGGVPRGRYARGERPPALLSLDQAGHLADGPGPGAPSLPEDEAWLRRLTPRQRQVAERLAAGMRQVDIANGLGLSQGRVSQLVAAIRRKAPPDPCPLPDPCPDGRRSLSPRLRQVLELAARGATAKESAAKLGLGMETIRSHRARARAALGARSLTQAVAMAVAAGLIRAQAKDGP